MRAGFVAGAALLAACATVSLEQARRDAATDNQRALAAAEARAAAVPGDPFTPHAAPVRPVDGTPPMRSSGLAVPGLRDREELLIDGDGTLALATVDCIRGDSCGCEVTQQYRFLRTPDHRVTVLRLRPTVHVRTIQVASCGYGCGQPAPRDEPTAQVLGVTQPDAITLIDIPYDLTLVNETCDHPIPRP